MGVEPQCLPEQWVDDTVEIVFPARTRQFEVDILALLLAKAVAQELRLLARFATLALQVHDARTAEQDIVVAVIPVKDRQAGSSAVGNTGCAFDIGRSG